MVIPNREGKINVTALIYSFVDKFDPDGSILKAKAAEEGKEPDELAREWESKGNRAKQRGNAVNYYVAAKKEGDTYIGSTLPEFFQIDEFLKEYEITERETWIHNDVIIGRLDMAVRHRESGNKYIVEMKSGTLGDTSYKNMNHEKLAHVTTDKIKLARIQAAMVTKCMEGYDDSFVLHVTPDLWTAYPTTDEDREIAETMFDIQRKKMKEAA